MPILDEYGNTYRRTPEGDAVRRWDSAGTNRLNSAHWSGAYDESVNVSISRSLADYRTKCLHEATDNPFIAGMLHTHTTDIVGPNGPIFQSQSSSKRFNKAVEKVWNEWFEMPDINGRLSGVDVLRQWIPQLWTSGEFIEQIVNDPRLMEGGSGLDVDELGSRAVAMRLLSIAPRRVKSPVSFDRSRIMVDGVECDSNGKPLRLHVVPFSSDEQAIGSSSSPVPVDIKNFLHCFSSIEPNQVRGFPWLAPALQTAADLRDYDTQILDGLRAAADWMVFFTCNNEDMPTPEMNGEVRVKRRVMRFLPNGYRPETVQTVTPTIDHQKYRDARLAELGRVMSMPLMIVKLDCADHTFSSANFDGQCYARGNAMTQAWLERVALTRLVRLVRREAALKVAALRSVPDDWSITFTWAKPPHVDPVKTAKALETMLAIGVISHVEACGMLGLDYETIAANIRRVAETRSENGIEAPLTELAAKLQSTKPPESQTEQRMVAMMNDLREWITDQLQEAKSHAA